MGGVGGQLLGGLGEIFGRGVRAVGNHGAEGVGHSGEASHGADFVALGLAWVAGAVDALVVLGGGLEPGVTFGPVQNAPQLARVEALVEDARAQGARIVCGGQRLDRPGYFYAPTIVAGLSNGARLVDEEQFGPVLPVIAYRTVDEAVALANASSMGLGGSVWGDVQAATALAPRLECGTVWVNGHAEVLPHCPFGGSKMSGVGVEFGLDGLLEYTQPQLLNING